MRHAKELFDLTGRVAIVTGGAGLYGGGISTGLAEAGATVIIASRNGAKCENYAKSLRERGLDAIGMSLDLNSDESIKSMVAEIMEHYGKIDILVNNAVDRTNLKPLTTVTREELQASANTNLSGQLVLSQEVLNHMIDRRSGSIINISSIRGIDCPHLPFYPPEMADQEINYATEKWAMVGMTKYMAGWYGKYNIRVNCIAPGGYAGAEPDFSNPFTQTYIDNCPLRRWADDDDIKGPAIFLASDASSYVTGATIVMDGGWTIW